MFGCVQIESMFVFIGFINYNLINVYYQLCIKAKGYKYFTSALNLYPIRM